MFLKIVKGSTVVDAVEKLTYVRQNPRNKTIIICDPEFANGIVSSDGSVIWHLEGLPEFSSGNYETVVAIEVCEDEYNSIMKQLYAGEEVSEEVRKTLTTTEMMDLIEKLTTEVTELKKQLESK
ncbi:MAG: hypothetical protein IJX17_08885 [Clostridia bacterium]|nr:hypothetical protein [Clostridia bacterium]MBQ8426110.1 hypothetical protein [Clostridia bacterium]